MQKKVLFISILAVTAILSMLFLFKNSVSQTTDFPGGAKAEKNFYKYKEDREEMIKMMTEGKIKKEDPYDSGFAFYYTPPQFKNANKDDHITARMYGERNYVFFQSVDSPVFGPGLTEGFLYSSTGKEPKNFTEFPLTSDYQRIDEHWFFTTDNDGYYD
ncbi:hypothetical protein [Bacillus sp. E(2018)]|uniref:hypothetical protein n=1 Tax=Bacillus sp. E(2018) TaxID=2502239 RepID=UPI0010F4C6E9|nr:hypothetical protein [Bacillus sp. E(2018)]